MHANRIHYSSINLHNTQEYDRIELERYTNTKDLKFHVMLCVGVLIYESVEREGLAHRPRQEGAVGNADG